jgi:hypothetical protein
MHIEAESLMTPDAELRAPIVTVGKTAGGTFSGEKPRAVITTPRLEFAAGEERWMPGN